MRNQIGILAATIVITSGSICAASWQEINTGLPGRIAGAAGLALDSATPSILYSWGSGGSLLKSTDGGASWNIVNGLTGVDWLVVDPKDSSTIYTGSGRGLGKSSNGGASWAFINIARQTFLVSPLVLEEQTGACSRGLKACRQNFLPSIP